MRFTDVLLPELDREAGATRRLIERVPVELYDWRPHARSMSVGELVEHLVRVASWGAVALTADDADFSAPGLEEPPGRAEQALHRFDQHVARMRSALIEQGDAQLLAPWTLRRAGREVFSAPRIVVLRTFVLNHLVHHRGQLTVYLRLRDIPLPPMYGPSADERTV